MSAFHSNLRLGIGGLLKAELKSKDLNGRKYKLYVVGWMGVGRGFSGIEVLRNVVVASGRTSEKHYTYLRATGVR